MSALVQLQRLLAYDFIDPKYLQLALTHRSHSSENYERLEFLGDAVLGLVIGAALYTRFPKADEGQLSRLRASLVRKETLAELGHELHMGSYLQLGLGEMRSGGQQRGSILADVVESILGAIYLDGGFKSASEFVHRLYRSRLQNLGADALQKDPKTRLQEYLQSHNQALPQYAIDQVDGKQHKQSFNVVCRLEKPEMQASGKGSSRRKAEQASAAAILSQLHVDA